MMMPRHSAKFTVKTLRGGGAEEEEEGCVNAICVLISLSLSPS